MNETYLHTMYPNLGPQIDEALQAGYSLQETHDHIAGKLNEARRNGYGDAELGEYVGARIDTRKPDGYNPFLAQLYTAAKALNEGVATFTRGITEPGQYVSEKLGFGRSRVTDDIVANAMANFKANADYWDRRAREVGARFIDEIIGEAAGAALPGITDFALDLSRAPLSGAIAARSQGQNEIVGAVTATAKRLALGKLFHEFNQLRRYLAAPAMAVTGAVETAAAGGEPKEIVKSAAALALYSVTGKGALGIREIKDLRSGKPTYEAQIRTVEELEANREKVRETIRKADRAVAAQEAARGMENVTVEGIPPTAQHLELMPEEYPTIRSVAIKQGERVFEARPGETTHVQVALSNGLDFDKASRGYITNEGKFVDRPEIRIPDPYEKVAMEEMRGMAEAVKPEVKPAGDVGAARARKETRLYGTLLEQRARAEAELDKLKNLATTRPALVMEKGNIEALMDYTVRVDRDVFINKMKKFGKFGDRSIWEQEGYRDAGDFWDKNAAVSPEIEKQVFDRNWSKVRTLAGDIDTRINKIIDTSEKMARAAYESGDRLGMQREHGKMVEMQKARVKIQREHAALKREVGTIVKRMTRLSRLDSMDPDYRDHIQSILEDYDLHVRSKAVLAEREGTREFVARMEKSGERVYVPEEKLAMLRKQPLNDISLNELRNLDDVIQSLAHQGVLKRKLVLRGKERDFQEVKKGLLESIKENAFKYKEPADAGGKLPSEREPKSLLARFRRKTGEIAGATKVEYIFDKLDGFKGKMYEVKGKWAEMFDMRVRAENAELRLKEADVKAIKAAIEPIKKDFPRMMSDTVEVDGRDITRMEAIEIYWNSKNEGNRKALREGFAMEDATIDRIVNILTPGEVAFADSIMTIIQDKGPDIARTLRQLTGEKMKMEKGYFPLWFDWELSSRAAERQQGQDLLKQVYSKIGVERGFTVSRVGGVEAPYLSFDVVTRHLDRVNHFIANAQAVRDFQRVIFDPDIRRSIEANAGEGSYREVVDWLKEWGNPRQSYMGNLDKWMGVLRHNATLAVLGVKASTAILQPTAYAQLINRIGFKNAMGGLADFYLHPRDNLNMVYELSPFMKVRSHTFDRDLKDFLSKDDYFSKWGNLKNHAMAMVSVMDLATTLPAWWSAYHLGMKKWGWDQARSIEYADMMIRRTQASGMPKDIPGVLRGSNFKKIFTMFYTYFSSTYNEAMRDVRAYRAGEEGALDVARSFFWLFAVQAAVQTIARKREDVSLKEFGNELVSTVIGTVPYIGPITNAMIYGYDYQPSPVFEIPAEVTAAVKAKQPESKLKHAVMAAGYAMGFPSRQAILTAQYLWDVLEGRDYNPANLIYRKKKEKKGGWK